MPTRARRPHLRPSATTSNISPPATLAEMTLLGASGCCERVPSATGPVFDSSRAVPRLPLRSPTSQRRQTQFGLEAGAAVKSCAAAAKAGTEFLKAKRSAAA